MNIIDEELRRVVVMTSMYGNDDNHAYEIRIARNAIAYANSLSNQVAPQATVEPLTDEQIDEIARPFSTFCIASGSREFDHQGFARALLAIPHVQATERNARHDIETAWKCGYYDAGYTHDSAYSDDKASKCADEILADVPQATVDISDEQIEAVARQVYEAERFTPTDEVWCNFYWLMKFARGVLALATPPTSKATEDSEEDAFVIKQLATLLADIAISLKGPELALHRHSYHDLPELAQKMKLELDLHRMQESERAAAVSPQAGGVKLIYQVVRAKAGGGWIDVEHQFYDTAADWNRRIVYTAPAGLGEAKAVADRLYEIIESVLKSHRLQHIEDDEGGGFPLVDQLSSGSTIETGLEEITLICDSIYNEILAAPVAQALPDTFNEQLLDEIGKELESVKYLGSYAEGVRVLKRRISELEVVQALPIAAETSKDTERLQAALEQLLDNVDEPPEGNCSCHLSPPCSDCVDCSALRNALSDARSAIAAMQGEKP
jgi:hypothetical protein